MVFCGSMTLRCLAAAPTTTPPLGWNETTDGWTLYPLSSGSTLTFPAASACATTEFEVPRSMPTMGSLKSLSRIPYRVALTRGRSCGEARQHLVIPTLEPGAKWPHPVSYTHLRAHETPEHLV